jgi:hypothetical protein
MRKWKSMDSGYLPVSWLKLGTNGAASIIAAENRLTQKIEQNTNHLTSVHFVAHQLNLNM